MKSSNYEVPHYAVLSLLCLNIFPTCATFIPSSIWRRHSEGMLSPFRCPSVIGCVQLVLPTDCWIIWERWLNVYGVFVDRLGWLSQYSD